MEDTLIKSFMELGTTGAFLVYLYIRNGRQEKSMASITEALQKIHASQDKHLRVLIKVANRHGLSDDANDLMDD